MDCLLGQECLACQNCNPFPFWTLLCQDTAFISMGIFSVWNLQKEGKNGDTSCSQFMRQFVMYIWNHLSQKKCTTIGRQTLVNIFWEWKKALKACSIQFCVVGSIQCERHNKLPPKTRYPMLCLTEYIVQKLWLDFQGEKRTLMHKILLLHKHNEVFEAGYTMDIDLNVRRDSIFCTALEFANYSSLVFQYYGTLIWIL